MKLYHACRTLCAIGAAALLLLPQYAFSRPDDSSRDSAASARKPLSDWERYRASADRHTSLGEAIAHQALSYRGARYRFGGTSASGIDCSGLAQKVYKRWGMLLPRTSTEQFRKGRPVTSAELRPGDLVFFHNTYRSGISHVGIYVGDGRFVHAANTRKGVIVSALSEPYYSHRLAGARRIAPDPKPEAPVAEPSDVDSSESSD